MAKKKTTKYTAKDIKVLKGLDPVRKRPGMYIGSTGTQGLHHLIVEIAGNSIDEAIMGYCDEIKVTFLPNNRIKIEDNGRGIPVDKHKETGKSALETIMTTLHAGGKFGGKAYKSTGGLHGVGISVVSALSTYTKVIVCRDGYRYAQEYEKGKAVSKLKKIEKCRGSGTTIIFEPDPEIFKSLKFNKKKIKTYLRQQAYLTKGLKIIFRDETLACPFDYVFYFEGGIVSYLKYLIGDKDLLEKDVFYCNKEEDDIVVESAFIYTDDYESSESTFVNNIHTIEGGSHLTGFRAALTRTFNQYARKNELLKDSDDNFKGRDVREGLTAVVSIKIGDPQFEGQTKTKLGNPEAQTATQKVVGIKLFDFLERNPQIGKKIIGKFLLTQKARKAAKAAKDTIMKKKTLKGLALPGKLASCSSRKPEESEIYIVEGQSAGGSSRQARDRHFQAILPLRGKILNVEKARLPRMLNSDEIKSLVIALGTAIADDFNIEKLRYHKVVIMCDADSDGNHIKTLLLTLFYRYFKPLIDHGYVYVACPPLYKIKAGRKTFYAFTENEKLDILKKLGDVNRSIQRYKGLGEMNPGELWKTTMDPENRKLLQVTVEDAREADRIFDKLMGSEAALRKKFIQNYADEVKNLDV
jgi:DNA gyrase subunit B